MNQISLLIKNYSIPVTKINSQRALIIHDFTERLNRDRDGVKYKKLKPSYIAVKLALVNL